MKLLRVLVVLTAMIAGSLGVSAQDDEKPSMVDRLLEAARNGSPVVRPQAANRLVALREEAAPRVLELLDTEGVRLAALGQELIEALGKFENLELRDRLWAAVDDPDFPWRPAAARGLAASIHDDELARAAAWCSDKLAAVRVAGISALDQLEATSHAGRIRGLLFQDVNDVVRREAALLFDRWENTWALAWVVEELDRTDRFFDTDTGKIARFAAVRALEKRLGKKLGFDAELPATAEKNAEARAKLRAEVKTLIGGRWPKLPRVARAGGDVPPGVLGVEVRSCRAGEFFLRFSADDRLWIGSGPSPIVLQLPKGSVARLLEATTADLAELEPATWGEPGCDAEQLYLRPDPDSPAKVWRLSKGADPVEGLRPDAMSKVFGMVQRLVPENDEGQAGRAQLVKAFESVGGSLDS